MNRIDTSTIEGLLHWLDVNEYHEHFEYLVQLRDSGDTNMFGASPYLEEEFGLDRREARDILTTWIRSFSFDVIEQRRIKDGREERN